MKCLMILILILPTVAIAGNRVGNGGDVVFCEKQNSYDLLDFYEARYNSKALVQTDESDPYKIVEQRLLRLKEVAPGLHRQYSRRLKTLSKDIEFRDNVELTNVKDSLHAFVGKGCKVQQVAIRLGFPKYNKGKRFVFSQSIWDKLDSTGKAGLLMHEIFYEHVFKLGIKDSRPVRQFVSFLFSDDVDNTSKPQFWAKINEWGIPIYPQ